MNQYSLVYVTRPTWNMLWIWRMFGKLLLFFLSSHHVPFLWKYPTFSLLQTCAGDAAPRGLWESLPGRDGRGRAAGCPGGSVRHETTWPDRVPCAVSVPARREGGERPTGERSKVTWPDSPTPRATPPCYLSPRVIANNSLASGYIHIPPGPGSPAKDRVTRCNFDDRAFFEWHRDNTPLEWWREIVIAFLGRLSFSACLKTCSFNRGFQYKCYGRLTYCVDDIDSELDG